MSRFYIETAKYGVGEGIEEELALSIYYKKDDEPSKWLTVVYVTDVLCYFEGDDDILDKLLSRDTDDDEIAAINDLSIDEFEGIKLGDSLDDLFEQIHGDQENNPVAPLVRYIAAFMVAPEDERDNYVSMAIGKYADEIGTVTSSAELDYLEGIALRDCGY